MPARLPRDAGVSCAAPGAAEPFSRAARAAAPAFATAVPLREPCPGICVPGGPRAAEAGPRSHARRCQVQGEGVVRSRDEIKARNRSAVIRSCRERAGQGRAPPSPAEPVPRHAEHRLAPPGGT